MRRASFIEDVWTRNLPRIGLRRSNCIVTVQAPWEDVSPGENIHFPQSTGVGDIQALRGVPIRWFQRADNSQVEIRVPNVKKVSIKRTIDDDAGTCQVTITNQKMRSNFGAPIDETEIGQHGYYTPHRGEDPTARARWGHTTNPWNRRLVKNAIIRTYQGYGGHSMTIEEAVAAGCLLLTGIWIVDGVRPTSSGELVLRCRDVMKLLIEQPLFPPLVPIEHYPLKYARYYFQERQITATSGVFFAGGGQLEGDVDTTPGDRTTTYVDSSADRWFGPNHSVYGHRGTDSTDGVDTTYALGPGNSGPDKVFATDWWEYTTTPADGVNAVFLHPWAGGYEMYVSVMEDGVWQGEQTIPYEHEPLLGRQPTVVNTGADIRYVGKYIVPMEESREYLLPRMYAAERVRVTFRHLYNSGVGVWKYRAGIREIKLRVSSGAGDIAATSVDTGVDRPPIFYAADMLLDPEDINRAGYITVSNYGFVDVFGDCREFLPERADDATVMDLVRAFIVAAGSDAGEVSSVALTPNGDGYWILYSRGIVRSFGEAVYAGEPYGSFNFETGAPGGGINKAATIISTNTGDGYWVITFAGEIFAYGDAEDYPDASPIGLEFTHAAGAHRGRAEDPDGLYLLYTNGTVVTRGAAIWRGNYDETFDVNNSGQWEIAIDIAATRDGGGYWVLTSAGRIQQFGNAGDFGQMNDPSQRLTGFDRFYHLLPTPTNKGYLLTDGDGKIELFGDTTGVFFGAPIFGSLAWLRYDGNYLDFSDIVRDIVLWAGFWYRGPVPVGHLPAVYGNIETTGMFSPEALPDEMFDKKPCIDPITELKESVGYIVFADDEGGFRFESPNWWGPGNFLYDGTHTMDAFEIDERKQLTDYGYEDADDQLRSSIIISSDDPTGGGSTTVATEFVPNTAAELRGLIKPAMWTNGLFQDERQQRIMAELVALHIWFSGRVGSVRCAANPCIGINDQVRIFERTTAETYLHYVRSVTTDHDCESGVYDMTLETHWLGTGDEWVVTPGDEQSTLGRFVVSKDTLNFLFQSKANAVAIGGGYQIERAP